MEDFSVQLLQQMYSEAIEQQFNQKIDKKKISLNSEIKTLVHEADIKFIQALMLR